MFTRIRLVNQLLYKIIAILSVSLLVFASGCNQSSDQRDFERAAYSEPDGFTRTNAQGQVSERDPDDWRVAPFFQGLIDIDPAYPNPVQSNDQVSIDLIVTGVESVSGLRVFAFYGPNNLSILFEDQRRPLPPGLTAIPLSPLDIAQFPENPQGLYRVVVTDGNENVITYGDIRVE
jgi:hypothetical protein